MKKEPKCSVCPDDVKSIPKNLKKYQVGTAYESSGLRGFTNQAGNAIPPEKVLPILQKSSAMDRTGFFSGEEKQAMFSEKKIYVPGPNPIVEENISRLSNPDYPKDDWRGQSMYNLSKQGKLDLPKYQVGTSTSVNLPPLLPLKTMVEDDTKTKQIAANQIAMSKLATAGYGFKGKVPQQGKVDYPATDSRSSNYIGNPK